MNATEPVREFWFTPDDDEGKGKAPQRYKLRTLDGMESMEILSEMRDDGSGKLLISADAMRRALHLGLLDWEHLTEKDGQIIPYRRNNFGRVPPGHLVQCANRIINGADLSEDEVKNS